MKDRWIGELSLSSDSPNLCRTWDDGDLLVANAYIMFNKLSLSSDSPNLCQIWDDGDLLVNNNPDLEDRWTDELLLSFDSPNLCRTWDDDGDLLVANAYIVLNKLSLSSDSPNLYRTWDDRDLLVNNNSGLEDRWIGELLLSFDLQISVGYEMMKIY